MAAVGLKVVEIVVRDNLAARAVVLGDRLGAGLNALKQRHACIGDARGRGLLRGLEFVDTQTASAGEISDRVTDTALELGLSANIVRAGAMGGTMRIAPSLTVTEAEIDLGLELLDAAITRVV